MNLEPERYECAEHDVDLTEQVQVALDDDGPPVAYRGSLRGALFGGRRAGPSPFQVVVRCPGVGGAGEHTLTCNGTRAS